VIEGAVQRVAAAPFDGFILQTFVRAGDTVRPGNCWLNWMIVSEAEQSRLNAEREHRCVSIDRRLRRKTGRRWSSLRRS